MKKILTAVMILFITSIQSIYANTIISDTQKDNAIYREYEVDKQGNDNFYNNLEDNIYIENEQYKKIEYTVSGGDIEDTINVTDSKEIITKTNSINEILNYLPREMLYSKDGYLGSTTLDIDNIKVTEIYNGYYEEYIEDTKQYFDLNKNDMDYIPKEIKKDGITLYLINVDWYTQTTKKTGENIITDLYRGEALYRGIKRINNPVTYRVIAGYSGTATKEIEKPYIYTVKYEKIEDKEEMKVEKRQNIVAPILISTTSGIFVVIILLFTNKNVKVYNLQHGRYKYLGRVKLRKSVIDLNNLKKNVFGNRYKFVLSNRAYKLFKNKNITIQKGNMIKTHYIDNDNFEINI